MPQNEVNAMGLSRAAILLFLLLAVVQFLYFTPLLPDQVATHFDATGQPDDWSSKQMFMAGNLIFAGGMAAMFLGLTSLVKKLPDEWINMPNKDYWLAPERRDQTLASLQSQMEWLSAITVALLVGIAQITIDANLAGKPLNDGQFWILFGVYMLAVVVWLVRLLRWAYAKPPRQDQPI
jgi:uncharacterized membrane protein